MAKSIKVLSLLATLLVAIESKGTISRELTFASSKAQTVAIDSHLFTVSYYDVNRLVDSIEQHHVYLNLTSTDQLYKPCKIDLIPEVDAIGYITKAAPIWHKIVFWGVRKIGYFKDGMTTDYTFLLIDPRTCTYQALPNITDSIRLHAQSDPKVIIYQDKLDIFYSSQTVCSPCKFDINGDKIDTHEQLKPEGDQVIDFQVRTVGKNHDYMIAYELSDGSTKLKLFDQYFNPKGRVLLRNRTFRDVIAVNSVQNHPYIGIISYSKQKPSRQPVYTVFDDNLNIVFTTYLPLLDNYNNDNVLANIDTAGNSYVTMIQREKRGPNWKITMVRYDTNGRIVDEVIVGKKVHMGVVVSYNEQAVLVDEREYCLVIHKRNFESLSEHTNIKCFNVSERI